MFNFACHLDDAAVAMFGLWPSSNGRVVEPISVTIFASMRTMSQSNFVPHWPDRGIAPMCTSSAFGKRGQYSACGKGAICGVRFKNWSLWRFGWRQCTSCAEGGYHHGTH